MKIKYFTLILVLFAIANNFAQNNLNNYKYVLVPKKYDFLKEENQHRLNELSQYLFNKYGFTALFEGTEYPRDLKLDRCLALRSNVIKGSGMFKTKLNVVLKDCNDKVVYSSKTGESREKEFKVAYNKALRAAFDSFKALNYKYEPEQSLVSSQSAVVVDEAKVQTQQEIEKLKQEIKTLKKETTKANEKVVGVKETTKVVSSENKIKESSTTLKQSTSIILYAQEIDNGFQLVDSSPKVIYKIKNTGVKNVFLVEDKSAIIYKSNDIWFLEHHTQHTILVEKLNIKF
ncbi:hypothetical protein ACKGJY_13735 [Hyunsoonleella sp. 2307UL5-6]|uniref:hypothetical protein n=1 Tax=Hyunsoonleella sp. 2307UL5-6 TaxID=3384768 RepID=UPI0039BCB147